MIDSDTPELLRNIPIQIVVDGVEITGEILFARFNDMSVVIRSPVSGLGQASTSRGSDMATRSSPSPPETH